MEKMKCSVSLSMYCVYAVVNIARVFLSQFVRYLESPVSLSERAARILRSGVQNASRAMREATDDGEVVKHLEGEGRSSPEGGAGGVGGCRGALGGGRRSRQVAICCDISPVKINQLSPGHPCTPPAHLTQQSPPPGRQLSG